MEAPHQFYVLEEARPGSPEDDMGGTSALKEEGFEVGDAPKCPKCGRFIGMLTWLPPFRVEIETWGREFGDVVKAGANDLVVSLRFKQLYERHQLKGLLGFEPVEIVRVKRHRKFNAELPKYFKASLVHSQASIDQNASGFEWQDDQPVCPECLWKQASGTLRGCFIRLFLIQLPLVSFLPPTFRRSPPRRTTRAIAGWARAMSPARQG